MQSRGRAAQEEDVEKGEGLFERNAGTGEGMEGDHWEGVSTSGCSSEEICSTTPRVGDCYDWYSQESLLEGFGQGRQSMSHANYHDPTD